MCPSQPSRKPRSRAKNGPAFVFVDASNDRSGRPHDEVSRAQIRRQAARSGRKSQGGQSTGKDDSHAFNPESALLQLVQGRGPPILTMQPSISGYEALRVKYNFDITYLASFTDVDVGKSASLFLHEHEDGQAAHLTRLLQQQSSSSFLSYLPSRYGASTVLDDAMHCLAARAGQIFGLSITAGTISALYARALQSLQGALTDNGLCLGADVYCATRLLTLYELIGLPEANHWVLHNRGGIKLVELRGPDNHQTRFDWMLLKSQGPSILVDELYRRKTSIFEAPAWQQLFSHASYSETNPDMSLWWEIFSSVSFVTGIMKNMLDLFQNPLPDGLPYTQARSDLRTVILGRAQAIHGRLHDIHARSQLAGSPSLFDLPITPESPDRIRLRGFFLYSLMQICRALATISGSPASRATAEEEAQALAAQALLIQYATTDLDPAMSWHFGQRNALAESIIGTRAEWISERDFEALNKLEEEGEEGERERFLGARWLVWYESWTNRYLSVALEA